MVFWGQHGFPSALRCPSCPIGLWGAGGLARERRGSARAVAEKAEGGSPSGGGMAEPLRQVYHPYHSDSYVEICFFAIFCNFLSRTMARKQK